MPPRLRPMVADDVPFLEKLLMRIKEFDADDQILIMELIHIFIDQPNQKDYEFIIAIDDQDRVIGFTCFGPTPITEGTFDLYWIAVDPNLAGQGIGTYLILSMEQALIDRKARLVVVETSSKPVYNLTREFYVKNGYKLAERIKDFFRDGEDRLTYVKRLRDYL